MDWREGQGSLQLLSDRVRSAGRLVAQQNDGGFQENHRVAGWAQPTRAGENRARPAPEAGCGRGLAFSQVPARAPPGREPVADPRKF